MRVRSGKESGGEKDKDRGRLEVNIQKDTILVIWVVFVLFLLTVFSNSSTVNMKSTMMQKINF